MLVSIVNGSIGFLVLHWILWLLILSLLAESFSRFSHWLDRFLVLCCFFFSIMFLILCPVVLGMVYSLLVVIIVVYVSSSIWLLPLLIMCGVNVSQMWLENSAACSLLLLAHLLSGFLIAGTDFNGFFIFFCGFL